MKPLTHKAIAAFSRLAFRSVRPKSDEEFSFCVGRPYPKSKVLGGKTSSDSICVYAHGTQVKHGTMKDAEAFRDYIDERTGERNFIYRLVRVQ